MPRGKKKEAVEEKPVEKKKRGRPKKVVQETVEADKKTVEKEAVDEKPIEVVDAEVVKKRGGVGVNGNCIPFGQRTKSELREISTKAGVASGVARRRKKELREFTRDFLMQEAAPVIKGNMSVLGVEAEQMTNLAAMVVRLFNKAVNNGDLNSARTLIEWAGMAPLQQERENEAIARMQQVMQLAGAEENDENDETDVVFYLPDNGRQVVNVGSAEIEE